MLVSYSVLCYCPELLGELSTVLECTVPVTSEQCSALACYCTGLTGNSGAPRQPVAAQSSE